MDKTKATTTRKIRAVQFGSNCREFLGSSEFDRDMAKYLKGAKDDGEV